MPPRPLPGSLAERGARLLAATVDELILLAVSLPMIIGAMPAMVALAAGVVDGTADASSRGASSAELPQACSSLRRSKKTPLTGQRRSQIQIAVRRYPKNCLDTQEPAFTSNLL